MRFFFLFAIISFFNIQCMSESTSMRSANDDDNLSPTDRKIEEELAAQGISVKSYNADALGKKMNLILSPQIAPKSSSPVSNSKTPAVSNEDEAEPRPTSPGMQPPGDLAWNATFRSVKIAFCFAQKVAGVPNPRDPRCSFFEAKFDKCKSPMDIIGTSDFNIALNQLARLNSAYGYALTKSGFVFSGNSWFLSQGSLKIERTPFLVDRVTLEEACPVEPEGPAFLVPNVIGTDKVEELSAMDIDPVTKNLFYVDNGHSYGKSLRRFDLGTGKFIASAKIENAQQIYGMRFAPRGEELVLIDTYDNELYLYKRGEKNFFNYSSTQANVMSQITDIAFANYPGFIFAVAGTFHGGPQSNNVDIYTYGPSGRQVFSHKTGWVAPDYGGSRSIVMIANSSVVSPVTYATVSTYGEPLQIRQSSSWSNQPIVKSTSNAVSSYSLRIDSKKRLYVADSGAITRYSSVNVSQVFPVSPDVAGCQMSYPLFVIKENDDQTVDFIWSDYRASGEISFCKVTLPADCSEEYPCSNEAEPQPEPPTPKPNPETPTPTTPPTPTAPPTPTVTSNPTPVPTLPCGQQGYEWRVVGLPPTVSNCVASGGFYDFTKSVCTKVDMIAKVDKKIDLSAMASSYKISDAAFDSLARDPKMSLVPGSSGLISVGNFKAVLFQFLGVSEGALDYTKCTMVGTQLARVVSGCIPAYPDASWASLSPSDKLARCLKESAKR